MFFIEPAQPKLRTSPPVGDAVKFDGYRVQLHKFASNVTLYSKGGSVYAQVSGVLRNGRWITCASSSTAS
jgi:ATP-dependent DNA ligase